MTCPECGFVFCNMASSEIGCRSCSITHNDWHKAFCKNSGPLTSSDIDNRRFIGRSYTPICPICEDRTNVTTHICKAKDKSKDYLDLMIEISKRDKK